MPGSIFEKRYIVIILSVIWGIGIAILFKRECVDNRCIIIREDMIPAGYIRDGNKCYKLDKYNESCSK